MVWVGIGALVLAALGLGAVMLMPPDSSAPPHAPSAALPGAAPAAAPPDATTLPPGPPSATPAVAAFDPLRELERIVEQQTRGFVVLARATKTTLTIGRDEFRFQVTSDRDGYVYLLGLGPDGTLAQLVPNRISGPTVRIRKGQAWRFPTGNGFYLQTQEPPGPTQLLVIVSERPREFDALGLQAADPIRLYPAPAELARLALAHAGNAPLLAGRARCPDGAACSDAYGAALLRFETVR